MATGSGDSFGRALINAIADAAGGQVGYYRSYTAKGWHAQISKLTSSDRGYQAAASVGLSVNHRTLVDWLAERREPSKANQALIAQAYRRMAGVFPDAAVKADVRVYGKVAVGPSDVRERGADGAAPFLVDGRQGDWDRMKEAWESGEELDEDDFEEWFIEDVLIPDLGETTDEWGFPGISYTVTIG